MKKLRLFIAGLFALFLLADCSDRSSQQKQYMATSSQQTKLKNELNQYTKKEDASFNRFEVKKDKIIITYSDADVESPVTNAGFESVLENSYEDAQKYQKKCDTQLPYEFKDKSSGVIAKSSYSGKGWYKQLSDGSHQKIKLDFKTGDAEEE